jgi:DNA topoisomerase I
MRQPESIKEFLNRDQFRLYQLIWQRFVASQMTAAIYDTLSVEVTGQTPTHEYLLRASGSTVRSMGFLIVYEEAKDEDQAPEKSEDSRIPADLEEGQAQRKSCCAFCPNSTSPNRPPRYTEASLVRTLEENGIGRPSTYAPILGTIQQRGYVVREGKRLMPTETGILVNDLITEHFPEIVDLGFTANMEEDLDRIASGDEQWVHIIREFYDPFAQQVEKAEAEMPEMNMGPEPIGRSARMRARAGHPLGPVWKVYQLQQLP